MSIFWITSSGIVILLVADRPPPHYVIPANAGSPACRDAFQTSTASGQAGLPGCISNFNGQWASRPAESVLFCRPRAGIYWKVTSPLGDSCMRRNDKPKKFIVRSESPTLKKVNLVSQFWKGLRAFTISVSLSLSLHRACRSEGDAICNFWLLLETEKSTRLLIGVS